MTRKLLQTEELLVKLRSLYASLLRTGELPWLKDDTLLQIWAPAWKSCHQVGG